MIWKIQNMSQNSILKRATSFSVLEMLTRRNNLSIIGLVMLDLLLAKWDVEVFTNIRVAFKMGRLTILARHVLENQLPSARKKGKEKDLINTLPTLHAKISTSSFVLLNFMLYGTSLSPTFRH
ncbi:hypothetical protein CEXT_658801 [Caerostris extrusa]|uniref:Uncharacterized protein n=1 Tax=Caerostris extrusa TaxID=172846 RepID=A0AAV4WFQ7_CAEEX|nr:hypothetical protein CEXT_658801 [Caerostris extrusa]